MTTVLKEGNPDVFLSLVKASGVSSWTLLQNCVSYKNPTAQQIPLALAWAEEFLGERGVARVHGGGFAGTIQAYVPCEKRDSFITHMERLFGKGSVIPLQIRPFGAPSNQFPFACTRWRMISRSKMERTRVVFTGCR